MGSITPTWLLDLCEEYINSTFSKSLEMGNAPLDFAKLSTASPIPESTLLRFSVMAEHKAELINLEET